MIAYHGHSGDWTACATDAEGWGRTRKEALAALLKMRRSQREDAETLDAEEGITRDRYGFPHHREVGVDD